MDLRIGRSLIFVSTTFIFAASTEWKANIWVLTSQQNSKAFWLHISEPYPFFYRIDYGTLCSSTLTVTWIQGSAREQKNATQT